MSVLATSTLAFAVIYVAVGGHALLMWAGQREDRVIWAFGMVCLSMGAYGGASAMRAMADDVTSASAAQAGQLLAASWAASFYIVFSRDLRGGTRPPALALVYAFPVGAGLLAAFGALTSEQPLVAARVLGHGPGLPQVALALGGHLVQGGLLIAMGVALVLAHRSEDRQRLGPPAWAPAIVVAAVVFDIFVELARVDTLRLSEFAFFGMAVAVSQRLVERGQRRSATLHRRTEELGHSARRLEATQQELVRREQVAAVGEISAIVAHELRNPLAIIRNAFTSLTRLGPEDRGWRALVDVVDEEADRLDRLVRDLLAYSRPLDPRPSEFSTTELLRLAAERSRRCVPFAPSIELEVCDRGVRCYADPELMCLALCNLLDNAYNAMPDGGRVRLEARDEPVDGRPATLFQVADNGPGIPEAIMHRVQELFFTTRQTGTGLGLAVVDRVVSAHGGGMQIESRPGEGTVVSIRVPRDARYAPQEKS